MRKYAGVTVLNKLPVERLFQLFVDGALHRAQKGSAGFDQTEPGCMQAFYNGLALAIQNLGQPLSVDLICQFHAAVTHNARGELRVFQYGHGQFRIMPMSPFAVPRPRYTPAGIQAAIAVHRETVSQYSMPAKLVVEHPKTLQHAARHVDLFDSVSTLSEKEIASWCDDKQHDVYLSYQPPHCSGEQFIKIVRQIVDKYRRDFFYAREKKDAQILAMVQCAQQLELLHPFADANGRTFVNIMLNFLLIQNGFPPATFYEPNLFDLYTDTELVDAVKDAISHTLFSVAYPNEPLFGYQAAAISPEEKEKQINITQKLRAVIQERASRNVLSDVEYQQYHQEMQQYLQTTWQGSKNIFRACAVGDIAFLAMQKNILSLAELQEQLSKQAPNNMTPLYKGLAPIHVACRMGQFEVVKWLLDNDATLISQPDENGHDALYHAAATDHVEMVQYLLQQAPYTKINNSLTILEHAAECGSLAVFKCYATDSWLLQRYWESILVAAARGNRFETVIWLLEKAHCIKQPDNILGKISSSNWQIIIKQVLRYGSREQFDILWKLYVFAEVGFDNLIPVLPAFMLHDVNLLKSILNESFLATKTMTIPLHILKFCMRSHNEAAFIELLSHETEIENIINTENRTLLHFAILCTAGGDVVQYLLSRCPQMINMLDQYGSSPLHTAITLRLTDMVRLLCQSTHLTRKNVDAALQNLKSPQDDDMIEMLYTAKRQLPQKYGESLKEQGLYAKTEQPADPTSDQEKKPSAGQK